MSLKDARAHWQFTVEEATEALKASANGIFEVLSGHGTMTIEYYAPRGTDGQSTHVQDEIYVIAAGTGTFFKAGERPPFKPGDIIFVEAGVEHRFLDFTDDFGTWVIFYGPKGGEAPGTPTA